jgi:uncharacterized protein YceH (UPF0502 family)
MVLKLARQPGAREQRWTHLLCGIPELETSSHATAGKGAGDFAELEARVDRLEQEIAELRASFARQACNQNE